MRLYLFLTTATGVVGLLIAFSLSKWISKCGTGTDRMKEIAEYIREGAMAFLLREYKVILVFASVLVAFLAFTINVATACCFILGAVFSALSGYFGMRVATIANVRTANAALESGIGRALKIAFRGGAVMGLCVAGLGVLGLGTLLLTLGTENAGIISGFGLGASSIALFGRVGGGIFTKAADVGADLVGKVEAGIPEDDPRNPAVIADNVGDNVGDVAGMGSDLFESYVGSIISAVTLAIALKNVPTEQGVIFPMLLAGIGILASIFAVMLVGSDSSVNPAKSLNMATYVSGGIVMAASLFMSRSIFGDYGAFGAVTSGISVGILIGALTEVYTSADFRPVKFIAGQAETGSATVIISGFSNGMLSATFPILFIVIGIVAAFQFAGLYGIALAAVGMLSTTGIVVAVDAYGPISDNAGGIAEMSNLPKEVRDITDKLDSVGNTTAAIGKGFAIGSAALTALALFVSYSQSAGISNIDLLNPYVVCGLFIGGLLPFLFSALTMNSVGRTAFKMIEEVRRQFRGYPGIMEGTQRPDYAKCVDISTRAALREMIMPGFLAIVCPIAVGFTLGVEALGSMLAGATVTGVLLAITMSNAGGAWDNAKKYIETGNRGGKGSEAHKAAVVGDTVGDPFKDTSGPSINILIKLMAVVSLVAVPFWS